MATTTANHFSLTGTGTEKGVFARIGARLVESRMRQADRAVAAYLLSLDDDTLTRMGYKRSDIEARDPSGYPFL